MLWCSKNISYLGKGVVKMIVLCLQHVIDSIWARTPQDARNIINLIASNDINVCRSVRKLDSMVILE